MKPDHMNWEQYAKWYETYHRESRERARIDLQREREYIRSLKYDIEKLLEILALSRLFALGEALPTKDELMHRIDQALLFGVYSHPGEARCLKCGKQMCDHSETQVWECAMNR